MYPQHLRHLAGGLPLPHQPQPVQPRPHIHPAFSPIPPLQRLDRVLHRPVHPQGSSSPCHLLLLASSCSILRCGYSGLVLAQTGPSYSSWLTASPRAAVDRVLPSLSADPDDFFWLPARYQGTLVVPPFWDWSDARNRQLSEQVSTGITYALACGNGRKQRLHSNVRDF